LRERRKSFGGSPEGSGRKRLAVQNAVVCTVLHPISGGDYATARQPKTSRRRSAPNKRQPMLGCVPGLPICRGARGGCDLPFENRRCPLPI
jgi:hypothetical protein